jgi:hypothetical protein
MANSEGESPDFDELKTPGEEAPAEPVSADDFQDLEGLDALGSEMAEETAAEPLEEAILPEGEPIEAKEAAEPEGEQPEAVGEKKPQKEPAGLSPTVVWGGAIGICVLMLVLAFLHVMFFATAVYVACVGLIGYAIWSGRATNTVYTVILACALVAVVTAVYYLWLEMDRYHLDIKAKEAKQRSAISLAPCIRPAGADTYGKLCGLPSAERRSLQ